MIFPEFPESIVDLTSLPWQLIYRHSTSISDTDAALTKQPHRGHKRSPSTVTAHPPPDEKGDVCNVAASPLLHSRAFLHLARLETTSQTQNNSTS